MHMPRKRQHDEHASEVEPRPQEPIDAESLAATVEGLVEALEIGKREEARLRANLEALEISNRQTERTLERLKAVWQVPSVVRRPKPMVRGNVAAAIREYLAEVDEPITAKQVEHHLLAQGVDTGAKNFYWSVYGALRAMAEVVGVGKEGETLRFALRDKITGRVPKGWRLIVFPRRTSLASRQRGKGPS